MVKQCTYVGLWSYLLTLTTERCIQNVFTFWINYRKERKPNRELGWGKEAEKNGNVLNVVYKNVKAAGDPSTIINANRMKGWRIFQATLIISNVTLQRFLATLSQNYRMMGRSILLSVRVLRNTKLNWINILLRAITNLNIVDII